MFYTIRSSVFASPTTYFNQAATSLSSALRKTAGKVADVVFTQTSRLPLGTPVIFPLSLATFSLGSIAYASFTSNPSLLAIGAAAHTCFILYLQGMSRNTPFFKNLSALRAAFTQAISDLNENRKTAQQVKTELQPLLIAANRGSIPDLRKNKLIDYLTQEEQQFQTLENAQNTEVYNMTRNAVVTALCGLALQQFTAPSEAHLG